MNCAACTTPSSGIYTAGCRGCAVLRLARSYPYAQSVEAGRRTAEYKRLLTHTFGDDWAAGHEQVKAKAEQLRAGE